MKQKISPLRRPFQLNQLLLSTSLFSLKRSEMHHTAESATRIYTTLLRIAPVPPKSHATRSKLKMPTSPQLRPPTIRSANAILSIIALILSLFKKQTPEGHPSRVVSAHFFILFKIRVFFLNGFKPLGNTV